MTKQKHPPGPYVVDNQGPGCGIYLLSGSGEVMAAFPPLTRGVVLAIAYRIKLALECHDDLLAACELVLSEHECYPFYESYGNADQALAACEAAIAKATGREGS